MIGVQGQTPCRAPEKPDPASTPDPGTAARSAGARSFSAVRGSHRREERHARSPLRHLAEVGGAPVRLLVASSPNAAAARGAVQGGGPAAARPIGDRSEGLAEYVRGSALVGAERGELRLSLSSGTMRAVEVAVSMDENGVRLVIGAEQAAASRIAASMDELRAALVARGVRVAGVVVEPDRQGGGGRSQHGEADSADGGDLP